MPADDSPAEQGLHCGRPYRSSLPIRLSSDRLCTDCLYLDMNGIIHQCKQGKANETEMMMAVFQYIEALVDIVRPKKYLFMGVDGLFMHELLL